MIIIRTFYIYKATNKINKKIYIGQTSNIGARVRQHLTSSKFRDCEFHIAIDDFGFENFIWEFLARTNDQLEAEELERKYIKEYNSLFPNGYNMTRGLGGYTNSYAIVCLKKNGEFVTRYDCLSDAQKDGFDISAIRASIASNSRCSKGYIFMKESDYLKNGAKVFKENPNLRRQKVVIQCDKDGHEIKRFKSVQQASDELGLRRSNVSAALTGASKSCGGFIFVYENELQNLDISSYKHRTRGKKIAQLDKDTLEVIAEYDSMSNAGKALGKSYKNIQKIVGNMNRTAYGYKWKLVD